MVKRLSVVLILRVLNWPGTTSLVYEEAWETGQSSDYSSVLIFIIGKEIKISMITNVRHQIGCQTDNRRNELSSTLDQHNINTYDVGVINILTCLRER